MAAPTITEAIESGGLVTVTGTGFTTSAPSVSPTHLYGLESSAEGADYGSPTYVDAMYGKGLKLVGASSQYKDMGNTAWTEDSFFTVALSLKYNGTNGGYLFTKGDYGLASSSRKNCSILCSFSGTNGTPSILIYHNAGSDYYKQTYVNASSGLSAGKYRILFRWSANNQNPEIWIDGVKQTDVSTVSTNNFSTMNGVNNTDFAIGCLYDTVSGNATYLTCDYIDEFTIWDSAISDADIVADSEQSKLYVNGVLAATGADSTTEWSGISANAGDTITIYNSEGSASATVAAAQAELKVTFNYNSTDYQITPPLLGYTSTIEHDWEINDRSDNSKGIWDSGSDYDIYKCECSFKLPDDEANTLLSLYSSTARGEEVEMTCSDGFFPFSPFRGDGKFTVRMIINEGNIARTIEGLWLIPVTLIHTGTFPAYTPPSGDTQGTFQIGSVTGLPYPKTGYKSDIKRNINTFVNFGETFVNHTASDGFENKFNFTLREGNCADVVEQLLSDRAGNTTLTAGDNHYIFGREKGDGSFTAFRVNPKITITHQNYNHFNLSTGFKWVS